MGICDRDRKLTDTGPTSQTAHGWPQSWAELHSWEALGTCFSCFSEGPGLDLCLGVKRRAWSTTHCTDEAEHIPGVSNSDHSTRVLGFLMRAEAEASLA